MAVCVGGGGECVGHVECGEKSSGVRVRMFVESSECGGVERGQRRRKRK